VQMTGSSEFFFRFDPFETGFCCLVDSFSSWDDFFVPLRW
jgi:hypothetical protein